MWFYVCEWVIEKNGIHDIDKLYDAAADLDCIMWNWSFSTEEGFRGARFIIKIPSLSILETFKRNIESLPFKKWYPIELKPEEILPLEEPVRISQWSGHNQSTFMDGFLEAAAHNERKMNRKDDL